jgi:hypothetical protein
MYHLTGDFAILQATIINKLKSRRFIWTGHILLEYREKHIKNCVREIEGERDNLED